MAMSQALGIAELIARSDLETNSAITAMRNGINATKPLAERRDSSEIEKRKLQPRKKSNRGLRALKRMICDLRRCHLHCCRAYRHCWNGSNISFFDVISRPSR